MFIGISLIKDTYAMSYAGLTLNCMINYIYLLHDKLYI